MSERNEKELADEFLEKCNTLREEIAKIIIGQEEAVRLLIISIFSKLIFILNLFSTFFK